MSTIIRTNTGSLYANRNLAKTNTKVSKSLDKLSSGYAINNAANNASGLCISEKMKAQITGLDQAYKNTQDGISLVQTAEGATTEIHDILNRMVTLSTTAANGTISDEVDREAIQTEIRVLCDEIDRIVSSTNFNGITLLDGTLAGETVISVDDFSFSFSSISTLSLGDSLYASYGNFDYSGTTSSANEKLTFELSWEENGVAMSSTIDIQFGLNVAPSITITDNSGTTTISGSTATVNGADTQTDASIVGSTVEEAVSAAVSNSSSLTMLDANTIIGNEYVSNVRFTIISGVLNFDVSKSGQSEILGVNELLGLEEGETFTIDDKTYAFNTDGLLGIGESSTADDDIFMATSIDGLAYQIAEDNGLAVAVSFDSTSLILGNSYSTTNGGLTMQIGDTSDNFNKVTVEINSLSSASIGVAFVDATTQESAGESLNAIRDAIDFVSSTRSYLGALQNRLEFASRSLSNTSENIQAANSAIRDTDMATELMEYTKLSIVTEASQSMLTQANLAPNQFLSLLEG